LVTRQQVTEAAGLRPGPGCKSPDPALAGQRDQHEGHPNVQTPEAENRAIPLAARASACGRSFWRRLRRIKPPAEMGCANPSGINVNPNSI